MKTDDLIRAMAADTTQGRPVPLWLMLGIVPSLVLVLLVVRNGLGFRADLATSLVTPSSAVRIVLAAGLGIASIRAALSVVRPEGRDAVRLWPLAAIGAVAIGLLVWAYLTTPAEARQMAAVGKTMVKCLVMIPLLSVLPVGMVLLVLRQGATTVPAFAGLVAGLAGSGLAAAIYALHCTEDSPLFYVTWYGLAIIGVASISSVLARWLLRW